MKCPNHDKCGGTLRRSSETGYSWQCFPAVGKECWLAVIRNELDYALISSGFTVCKVPRQGNFAQAIKQLTRMWKLKAFL